MTNTCPDHDPGYGAAGVDVVSLAAEVSSVLTDLVVLVDLVHKLRDSRQRNLGFLTPTARIAQDRLIQAERLARVDTTRRPVGLSWMRGTPSLTGSGHVTNAGNISAISVEADITFTLAHHTKTIVRELYLAGVCPVARIPADPTIAQQVSHLRSLIWTAPSPSLLAAVGRDLAYLVEAATLLVDGDDRAELGDCPHCERRTLVVYFKDGLVRCDRDPRTGHYAPCTCPNSYCECKRSPVSYRHEWHRDRGTAADGWWALSDRLALTRAT